MTQPQSIPREEPAAVLSERQQAALQLGEEREQLWKDRKLGHEWVKWDGQVNMQTAYLNESPRLILLALTALAALYYWIPAALVAGTAAYVAGVIEIPALGWAAGAASLIVALGPTLLLAGLWLSWLTGAPLVPFERLRRPLCKITIWLYPLVERWGMTRDRIGASTVALCNLLTFSRRLSPYRERLLVLVPRCMANFHKKEIIEMADERGLQVHVAATGRSAREKVMEVRPTAIVAIACQRDLVTGIRDVHGKIPVLSIQLKLPSGPCKDTFVALGDLKAAFDRF